mmetsp:Transcript_13446/g.15102  ORF Transcript_13446/g.15102 Transcript_13446/m.15102 type:complete len:107 (-) Transcript_13446:9-329(-)
MSGKAACALGLVLMLYAAYSMLEFRHYVKATGKHDHPVPWDIVVQVLLALLVCMYGAVTAAGKYKQILAAPGLATRSWDSLTYSPDFAVYNHRAKALAQIRHPSPQ